MLQTNSLVKGNIFKRLKHGYIITGCWNMRWSVHLPFQQMHTSVDISECDKPAWLRWTLSYIMRPWCTHFLNQCVWYLFCTYPISVQDTFYLGNIYQMTIKGQLTRIRPTAGNVWDPTGVHSGSFAFHSLWYSLPDVLENMTCFYM